MSKGKRVYGLTVMFFITVILIGTLILKLPICSKTSNSYINLLYQATSGVSATGFSLINISEQFTFFGQLVLIILVQLGSTGFMTFFAVLFMATKKRVRLTDLIAWGNETNTSDYSVVKDKTNKVFKYTFVIEFLGAWLLSFKFVPIYGMGKGIWYSIFHSISAFCNAGFDIIGDSSFSVFKNDTYLNIVLIMLMFFGGIGFFVLDDIIQRFFSGKKKKIHSQTKLILYTTFSIIILGTILVKIFNPTLTFLQVLFTVVSARNTGYFTVNLSNLADVNKLLLSVIMFIGGGPASNAGGIRVSVFAILILTTISNLRNKDDVVVFYKNINDKMIKKALTIFNINFIIVCICGMLITLTDKLGGIDSIFYVISLFSNTGLSTFDITQISFLGKCISIFLMYLGRIAPITFFALILPNSKKNVGIKYPDIDIML